MSTRKRPFTAYILSLIGGLLISIGGLVWTIGWLLVPTMGGFMDHMFRDMMWTWWGMGWISALISIVSGIAVVYGALMINATPEQHQTWGVLVLIFSIISFIGMDGFMIGALLGIAGGALAMAWRPPRPPMARVVSLPRYCANCGNSLPKDAQFCPACGTKVA